MNSRLRKATDRRHDQTVVFIHHYGGNYLSTHRHQAMVLALGYDCYSFDLSENVIPHWEGLLPDGLDRFGRAVVERWASELGAVLDSLPGEKIIYSFSYPSVSVPALLGRGPRPEVRAWICDGGPFLDMFRCQFNLFRFEQPKLGPLRRGVLTTMSYLIMGGPFYERRVRRWVAALDPGLPILSVRAGLDQLVPPPAIAKFFASNPRLSLETLPLPQSHHLEGLKSAAPVYRAKVSEFLALRVPDSHR